MQLRHYKTVMPPADTMVRVTAATFSPNNTRLAVVTAERVVYLFDENGERRDKFSTKASDKVAVKDYMVTDMVFSPDSAKLAIAQSDNIVFIYKLGLAWGEKKSICNKFPTATPVTCLCWPSAHPNEVVCGTLEGKVRIGQLRTNKASTAYAVESMVASLAPSLDGNAFLSGHADGSIYRFHFGDEMTPPSHVRFVIHPCVPTALAWGDSVCAAGSDAKVTFYDEDGGAERTFDYSDDPSMKAFEKAVFNPSGESVVLGNFNSILVFSRASRDARWERSCVKAVPNLYSVTAAAWKHDGSRVAVGSLCGVVDLYDSYIRRQLYRGEFEFTHVSPSQVIVKRRKTGTRIVLRSTFHCEIGKISVHADRYLVAHTPETLLVGDMESCKLSEVPWIGGAHGSGEKFNFEHASVCAVYRAGELTLIEYGRNEVLGSCLTEHMSPHLVSIRINERPPSVEELVAKGRDLSAAVSISHAIAALGGRTAAEVPDKEIKSSLAVEAEASRANKKLAYLIDEQTICVHDLITGTPIASVAHDSRVDWLELNARGSLLLFRDKRRRLHLFDVFANKKTPLLAHCSYVQWVPASDVVVAQSRSSLCVWYNISAPDQVTTYEIKGDVEDIERTDGQTEVVVDEGINTASYRLEEALISFGTAIDDRNYDDALDVLESLDLTPETEAMWRRLGSEALAADNLLIAQRCAAAVGDVARARHLHKTDKLARMARERFGRTDGEDDDEARKRAMRFWMVRARMAQLRGDIEAAENIFLDAGKVDDAIHMHQVLHQFDEAIAVAESRGHPEADGMRSRYLDFLMRSGQEEKAADLKEREGDDAAAVELYLSGGFPARAMGIVAKRPSAFPAEIIDRVADALQRAGLSGKAGALFERAGDNRRALAAYIKGGSFREAVDLARRAFPAQVVALERAHGDHLMAQKQYDKAILPYTEAGAVKEAIDAALKARQYARAAQLITDTMHDPDQARPYLLELARHYRTAGRLEEAEKMFVRAGSAEDAISMYIDAGKWEPAHRIASHTMSEADVTALFTQHAKRLASEELLGQAERVFLMIGQADLAITMYKRAKNYDAMVRLVAQFRRDLLQKTHAHLARQLEKESDFVRAERHFIEAKEWEHAVAMYRDANNLAEARRVAKEHGGPDAWKKEAYTQALKVGGEEGMRLLKSLGLIEQAIEFACHLHDWTQAQELAKRHMPAKQADITYKRALYLEDEGQFEEAEKVFVEAGKPSEAVDMYVHQKDWASAMRVAESHDQAAVARVLIGRGNAAALEGHLDMALRYFLDAKQPEMAVEAFIRAKRFPEAMQTAKRHVAPDRAATYIRKIKSLISGSGGSDADGGGDGVGGAASGAGGADDDTFRDVAPGAAAASAAGRSAAAASAGPRGAGGAGGSENHLESARMFEASREFSLAIDAYLRVSDRDAPQRDQREKAWMRAANLAATHDERRYGEVAAAAAQRMMSIEAYERAGDLFATVPLHKEAVDAYCRASRFDKARHAASEAGDSRLAAEVSRREEAHLRVAQDASGLEGRGNLREAVQILVSQGKWDAALERVARGGQDLVEQYVPIRVRTLLDEGKTAAAVDVLATYGVPTDEGLVDLYLRLTRAVFAGPKSRACGDETIVKLRDALYKVVSAMRKGRPAAAAASAAASSASGASAPIATAERLLMCAHFAALRVSARKLALVDLVADVSISLLRFCGIIPADRAFYEAGMACREANRLNVAYVMCNRYLDLAEAIEEGDPEGVDNTDFAGTDIPSPLDFPLPEAQYLESKESDTVRDWVLSTSLNKSVDQTLHAGDVPSSQQSSWPKCVVSGFPIVAAQRVECSACGSLALRKAWNAVVSKTSACPWCAAPQTPFY